MDWFEQAEAYLDELEHLVSRLDETLQNLRVETREMRAEEVQRKNSKLLEALAELEEKIAQREQLLRSQEAPARGVTLTEKIEKSGHPLGRRLTDRCRAISSMIASVNQRAVSLFVCQFHLSQLSGDIVRLLAGQASPTTYQSPSGDQRKTELGGGLFNEAA